MRIGLLSLWLPSLLIAQKPILNPSTLNFGSIKVGVKSAVLSTTLTNPLATVASRFSGTSTMEPPTSPVGICSANGFCWNTDTCITNPLPANGSCTLSYTFQPQAAGSFKGMNIIRFADGTADTLNLVGTSPSSIAIVSYINLSPSSVGVTVGSAYQFSAIPFDSSGKIIAAAITWNSLNKSIATIDSNGLSKAISIGIDTITASSGAITKNSVLTVLSVPIPPATQPGLFLSDMRRFSIDTVIGSYGYKGLNGLPWAMYDSTGTVVRHFIIVVQP